MQVAFEDLALVVFLEADVVQPPEGGFTVAGHEPGVGVADLQIAGAGRFAIREPGRVSEHLRSDVKRPGCEAPLPGPGQFDVA